MKKIKVSAPRSNPHICYIPEEYRNKINYVRKLTGKSLYNILAECSGADLSTMESIKRYKLSLRKQGFRNIGEWSVRLIDMLYSLPADQLASADLRDLGGLMCDNRS